MLILSYHARQGHFKVGLMNMRILHLSLLFISALAFSACTPVTDHFFNSVGISPQNIETQKATAENHRVEAAKAKPEAPQAQPAKVAETSSAPVALALVQATPNQSANYGYDPSSNSFDAAHNTNLTDLIDVNSCTRGLSSEMVTGQAGRDLLELNGLESQTGRVAVESAMMSFDNDSAPSSNARLNLKGGATTKLLMTAYGQMGRPYQANGQGPQSGFDAAGFTKWVYSKQGVRINAAAAKQISGGRAINKDDLRPGDLLVYKTPAGYHVGIYAGQGNFIHSSAKSKTVQETAAFGPEYGQHYVGARRYYDDPSATFLTNEQKMSVTSSAVKLALAELGPTEKPSKYLAKNTKTTTKNAKKSAVSKKSKAPAKKGAKKTAKKR